MLFLGPRPKVKDIPTLSRKFDKVVILLRNNELGNLIEEYKKNGTDIIHAPFLVGSKLEEELTKVRQSIKEVANFIKSGKNIFVHCSAGIHRTGTFAYSVFRYMGYDRRESIKRVSEIRNITGEGMMPFIKWAEETLVD